MRWVRTRPWALLRATVATGLLSGCTHGIPEDSSVEDTGETRPLPLINELMAANGGSVLDDLGMPSDWLELYHPGDARVDLSGWHLSDDWTQPRKHVLPAGTALEAEGYLVLWADGIPEAGPAHLGFRLSQQGEGVGLFDPSGAPVAWVEYPPLPEDTAWARLPNGSATWASTPSGTPGSPNCAFEARILLPVALGATWAYDDSGLDLGTAWREPGFDDSGWASGPAPLGYGDAQITVLSYGSDAGHKHPTTYFRLAFDLAPGTSASVHDADLDMVVDDGAVVWLNGHQAVRLHMPPGDATWSTFASETVSGAAETTPLSFDLDPPIPLVEGRNVLAVEVHQVDPASSDLTLDLSLRLDAWVPIL